jgi:hypothetical protein
MAGRPQGNYDPGRRQYSLSPDFGTELILGAYLTLWFLTIIPVRRRLWQIGYKRSISAPADPFSRYSVLISHIQPKNRRTSMRVISRRIRRHPKVHKTVCKVVPCPFVEEGWRTCQLLGHPSGNTPPTVCHRGEDPTVALSLGKRTVNTVSISSDRT